MTILGFLKENENWSKSIVFCNQRPISNHFVLRQGRRALTQVSAFAIIYFLFESYLFREWGRSKLLVQFEKATHTHLLGTHLGEWDVKEKIWVLLWQSSLPLSLKPSPLTQWWAAVAAVLSHITFPQAGTAGQCCSSVEGEHTQAEINMCSPAVLNAVPEIQWWE